jgi:hypothetical protein
MGCNPEIEELQHVWTELRDRSEAPAVADPANPTGNDLTSLLKAEWAFLSATAGSTLAIIYSSGWESVFGKVEEKTSAQKVQVEWLVSLFQRNGSYALAKREP